ncbi:MAG: hypothetical protein LBE21_09205 [Pseudomonadales bacterium]|jgi:hypothetical protein|nr:hypothetical protein [Pseudomonadales bacterium]
MRCFNHPENEAIGICKSCHRGLCANCATDLGHGLACKGKHESEVNTLHTLIGQNEKIYAAMPKARNAGPLFLGFMGTVFAGYGLFYGQGVMDLPVILGAGFIAFAIYTYFYNKKAYAPRRE